MAVGESTGTHFCGWCAHSYLILRCGVSLHRVESESAERIRTLFSLSDCLGSAVAFRQKHGRSRPVMADIHALVHLADGRPSECQFRESGREPFHNTYILGSTRLAFSFGNANNRLHCHCLTCERIPVWRSLRSPPACCVCSKCSG